MSELAHEIELAASEEAADVAAPVAAVVAEAVATEAAGEAVEDAVEHVQELVDDVRELVNEQQEELSWQRIRNEIQESENRVVSRIQNANTELLIAAGMLQAPSLLESESETTPTTPPSPSTEEAPTVDSQDAELEEAVLDPLAVAPAASPESASRRRPRGLGRQR